MYVMQGEKRLQYVYDFLNFRTAGRTKFLFGYNHTCTRRLLTFFFYSYNVFFGVCTLVQHTVVRAVAVSCGRPPTLTITRSETPEPIDIKFCKFDFVDETSGCAKIHNNRLHGGDPHIREI